MPVSLEILLSKEAGITVMTALNDMQRQSGEMYAWAAGHGASISMNNSSLAPLTVLPRLLSSSGQMNSAVLLNGKPVKAAQGCRTANNRIEVVI